MTNRSYWHTQAALAIQAAEKNLPPDATYEQRKRALFDAYPFGERKYWPYKVWLKAQRAHLAKKHPEVFFSDGTFPPHKPHLSPLERMMKKARQADDR